MFLSMITNLTMNNLVFDKNTANLEGGGLYISGITNLDVKEIDIY